MKITIEQIKHDPEVLTNQAKRYIARVWRELPADRSVREVFAADVIQSVRETLEAAA